MRADEQGIVIDHLGAGRIFGVTRERARQIERRALARLRGILEGRRLPESELLSNAETAPERTITRL